MYAVIMAGGNGTRLWPLSRQKKPKQLHAFTSEKPLVLETYHRLLPLIKRENIFISTTPELKPEIQDVLKDLPEENYIVEPAQMGTAAACALATTVVANRNKDALVAFFPADPFIEDEAEFRRIIAYGEEILAKYKNYILTIGINPTSPNVNYGYIQMDSQIENSGDFKVFSVKEFKEKPDLKTAKKYVASWEYLWNAGIFLWNASHFMNLVKKNLPNTNKVMSKIKKSIGKPEYEKVLKEEYAKVEKTTVDYAIIEKTKNIIVIPGDFGWSDIGTWGSILEVLSKKEEKNIIVKGNHIGVNNSNVMVLGNDKLIATVGLKDVVVIDLPDVTLVCNSKRSHEIKDLLQQLKDRGLENYL